MYIYHIASQNDWLAGKAAGAYRPNSLAAEGFIHCSNRDQVVASAERYFAGRTDLVLLCIQTGLLTSALRLEGEQLWPHLYGPLNLEAIEQVLEFPPLTDGKFQRPPEI